MSFASILQRIIDECGGGLGAALMGNDGIAIEEVKATGVPAGVMEEDVGTAGAEFGRILDDMRKVSDSLGGGALSETVVSFARFSLIFRVVDEETHVIVAVAPDANLGKARYLIRRELFALREQM